MKIRSPNIWDTPDVYELENLACDRAGVIESAIAGLRDIAGADLLDIGCGTGFHLSRFAGLGARVVGVEPYLPLAARARERVGRRRSGPGGVGPEPAAADPGRGDGRPAAPAVVAAAAEALPLPDHSVDIAHARWAYFFGAGCEPGLAELARVLRPGGVAVVVDNDATRSTFGAWFTAAYPAYDPVATGRFWDRQGFATEHLTIHWTFDRREDLDAVVRIELPPATADAVLADHDGLDVDYAIVLRWRRY